MHIANSSQLPSTLSASVFSMVTINLLFLNAIKLLQNQDMILILEIVN